MAKLFLVVAIVLTLCTSVLSFLTKGKVDSLQGTLTNTKRNLQSTQADLGKTKSDLKKTGEDLAAASKTVDDQKTQIGTLTADASAAKAAAEAAKGQLEGKEKEIADLNNKIADIQKSIPTTGSQTTAEQVAAMTAQLTTDKAQLADKQQTIDSMQSKMKDQTTKLESVNGEVKRYREQIALHSFTGRIEAVNPNWNFVVINVGDKQGATINSQLIIVRNGQNIGKARITSVEPGTSIADVIPGSMPRGVAVQPGDEVVFAGNRGQAPASSAAPTATPSSGSGAQTPPLATSSGN